MSENEAATANNREQGSNTIAGERQESGIRGENAGITAETPNNDTASSQTAHNDGDNAVQAQTAANEQPQPELDRSQDQAGDVTAAAGDKQESSTAEAADHTQSSNVDNQELPASRTTSDLAAGSAAGPAGSNASTTAEISTTQDVSTSEDTLNAHDSSSTQATASDNAPSGLAAAAGSTSEASAAGSDAAQDTSTSSALTPSSGSIQRSTSSSGTAVAGPAGSGTSSSTTTSTTAARPATTKKFTSSLSMNKKFLEKAGAATGSGSGSGSSSDTRLSSAPSSISLPKAGPSFAALSIQTTTPSSQNASPTLASATASTSIPSTTAGPISTTNTLTGASSSPSTSTLPTSTSTASSATNTAVQTGSSHPRLLTGKLSTLSGGGIGLSSLNTPTATWGRPSPAGTNGSTPSSAFGSRGFVPAPPVSGSGGQAPLSASGIGSAFGQARNASGGQRSSFASLQQGQGRAPQSVGAGAGAGGAQAPPWLHAARAAAGMGNARPLEHDFPSFQETARAEEQRQHALYAKEKAEKLAAVAQAAYNARVLDNLKSFSGIHDSADPNKTHWDELDDDDELEDILEFGDGTKYEVPPSATLPLPSAVTAALEEKQGGKEVVNPTKDEVEAFRKAQKASNEAKALQVQYENTLAAAEAEISASAGHQQAGQTGEDGPFSKGERFVDDFDRRSGSQTQAGPSASTSAYESSAGAQRGPPTLNRESSANRTLFNERLGRFEPYAGGKKGVQASTVPGAGGRRGDRRASRSPPAVLRRPSMGQGSGRPLSNGQLNNNNAPNTAPLPSQILSPPKHNRQASSPLLAKQTIQPAQQQSSAPKKVENAWARPPMLAKQPPPGQGQPASALQGPTPAEQSKQGVAVSTAASSALPALQQQPAQQSAQVKQPAQPAEDPEEAYKKEMQSIAERARKRRQDEEAERQAQIERAKKKAQEIEEKMKAAASLTSPVVEQQSALQPAGVQILAPQASAAERADRQASWRRASTDIAPTIQQGPQASRPPVAEAAPTSSSTLTISKPIQVPPSAAPATSQKAAPSSAAFAALANMATSSFSSFRKPVQPSSQSPTARAKAEASEPVVEKHATALPEVAQQQGITTKDVEIVANAAASSLAKPSTPPPSLPRQPLDALLSPAPAVPTVRLGRTASSADIPSSGSSTDLARMAFPQPTIMIASASQQQPATGKQDPTASLSQLDKIMLAVRAAQDGLTAANETKKRETSQKSHLDDALSKISQAMGQAAAQKGKAQQGAAPPLPTVRYVPEIFEYTATERPPSPRIWKTFSMRLPSLKRELASVPYGKLRQFENPRVPYTVHSSSYIPPKGRPHVTLDEHLFPSPAQDEIPVIKFSKFRKLMPEATSAEAKDVEDLAIPDVQSVKLSPSTSMDVNRKGRSEAGSWRRMDPPPKSPLFEVFVEKESLTVTDPPYLAEQQEEDFTTVSYANLDFEEPSSSIKVSFPARAGQPTASQAVSPTVSASSANGQLSPESSSRFKTYGPKLPENSTVAFRRSISANRGAANSGENMFMVTSEIAAREAESAAARTAFESVPQESASLKQASDGMTASFYERMNGPATFQDRQPSPIAPTFPTLSPLHAEPLPLPVASVSARSVSPSRSPYESARKIEIPKNVQEELDRLNESVGSAPLTVPSRHDTPSSFLGRASSPWASGPGRAHAAGHFNILDPSMSVWSRPTEETAAAAAAASLAAGSADKPQENSLRGIIDEFPAGLPSSAMDMQLSESEQRQASPDKALAVSPPEIEKLSDQKPFQKNRTASAMSPMPSHRDTAAAEQTQHQRRATVNTSVSSGSRHGSFAYPSSQAFPGDVAVPSPYASHATLPYAPAAMPGQQSAYSPVMQAQYSPYVVSGPNAYGHQQYATAANGMQYSQYPMGMAAHDGRQAGMWVQTPMGPGMVNGQYANGMSHYAHHQSAGNPAMQAYAPQSMMPKGRGQAQYYGQPMSQAGHRASPMPITGATSYIPYAQRTAHAVASPQYSMFSPQLTSPPVHPQGYRASSAGPQQYSNRRGGSSPSQPW